jgi:4-diphosphocytidyl-2-C-methyl-D-erythritol kinase
MQLPGPDYLAPAKLNLFLHVVGRRADGYHLLQSVFTLIDRCDRLRLRVREDGLVARMNDVAGVPPQDDLAVRAARALQAATGTRLGVDLELEKHIPMGGGLGGGSSDAAAVLMALDRLWDTRLGDEALARLGLGLGADVPFFLFGGSAWAEGIGDRLAAVTVPTRWYLVLTPPVAVPTPVVFAAPELTRDTEPLKMEDFSAQPAVRETPGQDFWETSGFRNDLEAVVTARFPVVREHLEWLRRHGNARMTGSGGCVFAAFGNREEAQRVLDKLPASMHGFIAQGLTQHPLRAQ